VVLAHDVDDFSKIWQAMGRSRTMNETVFSIYSSIRHHGMVSEGTGMQDIKKQELTRHLYVHNCECKMAGNISSIYLTLVALFNLSQGSFYYRDEIVNTFLEKMEKTILGKVKRHQDLLVRSVLGTPVPGQILLHILMDKCRRSSSKAVAEELLTEDKVEVLLRHIVQQKYEQRVPSGDIYDDFIHFLSGEQHSLMEISYTKQQQKQKQKQQTKNQDSDAMGVFDKKNRLSLSFEVDDYFKYTLKPDDDVSKIMLNLPCPVPILSIDYNVEGILRKINVYPTLQFLYSHHIQSAYITQEVQNIFQGFDDDLSNYNSNFLDVVEKAQAQAQHVMGDTEAGVSGELGVTVRVNNVRQNPQYTIAGLQEGVYVIGMKDQFNIFDMQTHPLGERIQYIADEMGFVLFDKTTAKNVDSFGPYFIEQYILMEVLSKQEVAQNVMDYYCNHKETLQRGLTSYGETQGKGFVCWRFLINETAKAAAMQISTDQDSASSKRASPQCPEKVGSSDSPLVTGSKRPRASDNAGTQDADEVTDGFARALDI
jgi:hypothetical protein